MATRGFRANVIWIIQVIEIIRTILPLRKCYGFENRGRVGIRVYIDNTKMAVKNESFLQPFFINYSFTEYKYLTFIKNYHII